MRRPGVMETAVPNLTAGFDIPVPPNRLRQTANGAGGRSRRPRLPSDSPSCRLPAHLPVSRFAGRARRLRENNFTLSEEMGTHVSNQAHRD